jgi:hypothetical protein
MSITISAITFTVFTVIVIIFQACLAAGVPWGEASMGGKYPGKYPPKMRIAAIINILILVGIAVIVVSRAGLILPQLTGISRIAIWFIVVYFIIATVLNSITPSKIERIWAPVALVQLITSIIVAIS